jgi:hypothetical protein
MSTEKNRRTDEILNSLEGVKRAGVPDFFYTRLMARMEKGLPAGNNKTWILKPVYAMAVIILVLIINAFVFFNTKDDESTSEIVNDNETLQQSIAAEYSLTDNNSIYDLNTDK